MANDNTWYHHQRTGPRQPRLSQHAYRHIDRRQRRRPQQHRLFQRRSAFRTISAAITTPRRCSNNLIYANSDAGNHRRHALWLRQPNHHRNTVYQPVGDAIRLLRGSPYVRLRDNILWVQSGYDILVPADSEVGFQSDYNALVTTGGGKLGQWEGRDFTSRVDWFYELGFDGHSQQHRSAIRQSSRCRWHLRLQRRH